MQSTKNTLLFLVAIFLAGFAATAIGFSTYFVVRTAYTYLGLIGVALAIELVGFVAFLMSERGNNARR